MANSPPYTLTHESVTVIVDGKPHTFQRGTPNYTGLRQAILNENWDAIPRHLTVSKSIAEWAKGDFTINGDDRIYYKNEELPEKLTHKIVEMATSGEDPTPLFRFYERLQKNPSFRSVQQLYPFMAHEGIPLTEDGCFLAYKSVRADFKDVHSGTFDNHPGTTHEMPRNKISDDPNVQCHEGFHVGALNYVRTFGGAKIVICKVDPADVVCVPYDHSMHKMRVSKYKVIGMWNGEKMPNTIMFDKDLPDHGVSAISAKAENDEEINTEESEEEEFHEVDLGEEEGEEEESDLKSPDQLVAAVEDVPGAKSHSDDPQVTKKRTAHKGWTKFDQMGIEQLMEQSIDDLRQYAGKGLEIVGASKIPGGKAALVSKILGIRA